MAARIVKCIVTKGQSFFDNNREAKLCREYKEGEIVTLDLGTTGMKLGPNLRELSPDELKMTAAALKKRELGQDERPVEAGLEEAA